MSGKSIEYMKRCFHICPLSSSMLILEKAASALVPTLQAISIAGIIDIVQHATVNNWDYKALTISITILFVSVLVQYGSNLIEKLLALLQLTALEKSIKPCIISKLASLPYSYFEDSEVSDLIERLGDDIPLSMQKGFLNILSIAEMTISIVGPIAIIMKRSPIIGIACFGAIFPVYFLARNSGTDAYDANRLIAPYSRRAKYLRNILMSREYSAERILYKYGERINRLWNTAMSAKAKLDFDTDKRIFIRSKAMSICFTIAVFVVALLLLVPMHSHSITSGTYVALLVVLTNIVHTLSWKLSELLKEFTAKAFYIDDYLKLLSFPVVEQRKQEDRIDTGFVPSPFKSLEFRRVSFCYPRTKTKILNDFNFLIEGGKNYAFVGRNGCGKSTVIKLLAGLYDDYSGEILINGTDIRKLAIHEKRKLLGIVFQEYAKYQIRLDKQISVTDSPFNDDTLTVAMNAVSLDLKDRRLFPNGYQTNIGKLDEDGVDFSEGQWQRLAIARILARGCDVILLDEPASALDPIAESKMFESIKRFLCDRGKTVNYITHRLSTARQADIIFVMNDGHIEEYGSHESLMLCKGLYSEMYELQSYWYNEKKEDIRL